MPDARYDATGLPPGLPPSNHGRTRAAWTMTWMVVVGALVAAVGLVVPSWWLLWVGIGVMVMGPVVGKVMQLLGMGQPRPDEPTGAPRAASG